MYCPHCGAAGAAAEAPCAACGRVPMVAPRVNMEADYTGVCLACQAPHYSDETFCGQCGRELAAPDGRVPPSARGRVVLLVALLLLLASALSGGAAIFLATAGR